MRRVLLSLVTALYHATPLAAAQQPAGDKCTPSSVVCDQRAVPDDHLPRIRDPRTQLIREVLSWLDKYQPAPK